MNPRQTVAVRSRIVLEARFMRHLTFPEAKRRLELASYDASSYNSILI